MSEGQQDSPAQGISVRCNENGRFAMALDWAVNYRGDVTLVTSDGDEIECYVFDRVEGGSPADHQLRYMTKSVPERTPIRIGDISEIRFSGKDTAAGKSFDRWIQKYVEKKLAGETASIDCDALDDE